MKIERQPYTNVNRLQNTNHTLAKTNTNEVAGFNRKAEVTIDGQEFTVNFNARMNEGNIIKIDDGTGPKDVMLGSYDEENNGFNFEYKHGGNTYSCILKYDDKNGWQVKIGEVKAEADREIAKFVAKQPGLVIPELGLPLNLTSSAFSDPQARTNFGGFPVGYMPNVQNKLVNLSKTNGIVATGGVPKNDGIIIDKKEVMPKTTASPTRLKIGKVTVPADSGITQEDIDTIGLSIDARGGHPTAPAQYDKRDMYYRIFHKANVVGNLDKENQELSVPRGTNFSLRKENDTITLFWNEADKQIEYRLTPKNAPA